MAQEFGNFTLNDLATSDRIHAIHHFVMSIISLLLSLFSFLSVVHYLKDKKAIGGNKMLLNSNGQETACHYHLLLSRIWSTQQQILIKYSGKASVWWESGFVTIKTCLLSEFVTVLLYFFILFVLFSFYFILFFLQAISKLSFGVLQMRHQFFVLKKNKNFD